MSFCLQKTSVFLWSTVLLLWLPCSSLEASATLNGLTSTFPSVNVKGARPPEFTSRRERKGSSSVAISRVIGSPLRRRLLQRSVPSDTEGDGGACNLTESQQRRFYSTSTHTWNISDAVLKELGSDIQAIAACAVSNDLIVFSTTRKIQPPRSIIVTSSNVTMTSHPEGPVFENGRLLEAQRKARLKCPSSGDLLVIRSVSIVVANIIFEDCSGDGNVVSIETDCDENLTSRTIHFHHVEFTNLNLSGYQHILEAFQPSCAHFLLENVTIRDNICGLRGCLPLPFSSSLKNLNVIRNRAAKTSPTHVSPSMFALSMGSDMMANSISASSNDMRLFHVVNGTLRLRECHFAGNALRAPNQELETACGSVLFSDNSTVNIWDSLFTNNSGFHGGAVYAFASDVEVSGCTFRENDAGTGYGGALVALTVNISILNSTFLGNNATLGGACIFQDNSTVNMNGLQFSENHASEEGGAIHARLSVFFIGNTLFDGNRVNEDGSVMFMQGGFLSLLNVNVTDNQAGRTGTMLITNSSADANRVTFRDNIAGRSGGGLFVDRSNIAVAQSTFRNNSVEHSGGAMFATDRSNLKMSDSVFDNNSAGNEARDECGAICVTRSEVSIIRTNFTNNIAAEGGCCVFDRTNATLEFVLVSRNQAIDGQGGGICAYLGRLNGKSLTFQENRAVGLGGGLTVANLDAMHLSKVLFQNNIARHCGGGIFGQGVVNMSLKGARFLQNIAGQSGGGIYGLHLKTMSFKDVYFQKNTARENGGGLFSQDVANTSLVRIRFESNNADDGGGFAAISLVNASLYRVRFMDNIARTAGGGLFGQHSTAMNLSNVDFPDNTGPTGGGGYFMRAHTTMESVRIQGNKATDGSGGGIALKFGTFRGESLLLQQNQASRFGGGLALSERVVMDLVDVQFLDNTGKQGGGGLLGENMERTSLLDVIFQNNTGQAGGAAYFFNINVMVQSLKALSKKATDGSGGGIYHDTGSLTGDSLTFHQNEASRWGGGMAVVNMEATSLSDVRFQNNTSSSGGAIASANTTLDLLSPCLFIGNNATNSGGNILQRISNSSISSCLFTDSSADNGGSLWIGDQSHSNMSDCFFDESRSHSVGGGIYIHDNTTVFINGSSFSRCASLGGGAIFTSNGIVKIEKSNFQYNNVSDGVGGALRFELSNVTVRDTIISSSQARHCGGVYVTNDTHLNATNLSLHSNVATDTGGGLGIDYNSSLLCHRCDFRYNKATWGAGMHAWAHGLILIIAQLQESTFVNNTASSFGGGMLFRRQLDVSIGCTAPNITCGHVVLLNTTFVNNTATCSGSSILTSSPNGVLASCEDRQRQYDFVYLDSHSSLDIVHPNKSCPTRTGDQLEKCGEGKDIGTYGRDLYLSIEPNNESWMTGDIESGFVLENVTSGKPLPIIFVTVLDAYGKGPTATLPHRVEAQMTSTRGFVQGTFTTNATGGSGNFSNIVGFDQPGNYILKISPSSVMLREDQITIHVRACHVGEETTSNGDICQKCDAASYNFDPQKVGGCTPCPEDATCEGRFIIPKDGYWHKSPCHYNVMECLNKEACNYGERQSNLTGVSLNIEGCDFNESTSTSYSKALCREGNEGPLCGSCADSYGLWLGFQCSKCPSAYGSVLALLFITLYLLVLSSFTIRGSLSSESKTSRTTTSSTIASSQTIARTLSTKQPVNLEMVQMMLQDQMSTALIGPSLVSNRLITTESVTSNDLELTRWIASEIFKVIYSGYAVLCCLLKVMINFLQVIAIAASINVQWTDGMLTMFETSEYLGALTMTALSMPIDCIVSSRSAIVRSISRMLLSLFFPCMVLSIFAAVWGFITKQEKKEMSYFWKRVTLSVIAIVYISYLGLTSLGVKVFYCVDVYDLDDAFSNSRTKYWAVDTAIRCYKKAHFGLIAIAVFVLVLVSLAFPLVSAIYLSRKKVRYDQTDTWTFETMGFLYRAFKEKFVFWESVVMFRKACLSVIVVFSYPLGGQIQGLLALGVLVFCLYLQQTFSPYREDFHKLNYYESGSLLVSCFTFMLGQFFVVEQCSDSAKTTVELVIITLNTTFFTFLLVVFFRSGMDHMRVALRLNGLPIDDNISWWRILKLVIKSKKSKATLSTN